MQRRSVLLIRSSDLGWSDLRTVLQALEDIEIVGDATTAEWALHVASTLRPDFIISAAWMEGASTRSLLLDLRQRVSPESRIIVFAARLNLELFAALDGLQLAGYLLWSELSSEALRPCLDAALTGDIVLSSRQVAREYIATQCRPPAPPPGLRLTERERTILRHLAGGLSHKEIAEVERMRPRTVERIIADLREKLDAPTAFALGVKAAQLGLVL